MKALHKRRQDGVIYYQQKSRQSEIMRSRTETSVRVKYETAVHAVIIKRTDKPCGHICQNYRNPRAGYKEQKCGKQQIIQHKTEREDSENLKSPL